MSLSFEIALPYLIGDYIEATQKKNNKEITEEEFDKDYKQIKLILAISAAASLISRFIYHCLFVVIASKVQSHLRYDIFHCYFSKCANKQGEIDKMKSMK